MRSFGSAGVVRATVCVLLAFIACTALGVAADSLPRRGLLGVSTTDQDGRVKVLAVLPNLPGAAAGLQRDDVVATVDGTPVANNAEFLQRLRRPGGRAVSLGIVRAGAPISVPIVLVEAPKESDPAVDTTYGAIDVQQSLRRTLLTAPHAATGKHAAVLIVGGIGCYSVDVATNAEDAYTRLAHDLSRRGFVALRLEKSGVGDSQGPPCPTVDYVAEAASYGVAFDALRNDPLVDPTHVYVLGHSIGTVTGPRLAAEKHAAGVIAADGVARNWLEYELLNSRRQEELSGASPADVDDALLLKEACMHRMLVEKQSRSALVAAKPECKDYTQYPAPDAYLQELAPLNMAQAWAKVDAPVLAIYGSADFVTDEADHRRIVDIVNGAHPGAARLVVIPGMDHYLTPAVSQRVSFDKVAKGGTAPYDRRFSEAVTTWLCERERCPAVTSRSGPMPTTGRS